jgi:hypothetical protein
VAVWGFRPRPLRAWCNAYSTAVATSTTNEQKRRSFWALAEKKKKGEFWAWIASTARSAARQGRFA